MAVQQYGSNEVAAPNPYKTSKKGYPKQNIAVFLRSSLGP